MTMIDNIATQTYAAVSEMGGTPDTIPPIPEPQKPATSTNLALARPITLANLPVPSEALMKEKLNQTSRREFRDSITRRSTAMLRALDGQIGGDVDIIIQNLRQEAGIELNENQLKDLIKGCDEQIKNEITIHLGPEKNRIESIIEKANDEFDQQEREMKARHKAEWNGLRERRRAKNDELKLELVNAEASMRAAHTQDLAKKKQEYVLEMGRVKEKEAKITTEAERQHRLIQTRKSQLKILVEDCTGRALEQLSLCSTRGDAIELVNLVPTVQEATQMCRSAKGLATLLHRLDPSSYPAPTNEREVSTERTDDHDIIDAEHVTVDTVAAADAAEEERKKRQEEERIRSLDQRSEAEHDDIYRVDRQGNATTNRY